MPSCLKYIVSGGESLVVSAAFLFELRNRDMSLLNNYGCTELGTMFFSLINIPLLEIQEYNHIPIGQPLPGIDVTLSDNGELLIYVDKCLNRYHNAPHLMHSKFNFTSNENQRICFFTGDIAKRDGENYYIVGRLDNCLNVRGFRVEIEFIERQVSQILGGADCCVVHQKNAYDEISLICCYQAGIRDTSQIQKQLKEILPKHMIPSKFIMLKKLPKMSNGKIDRVKLLTICEQNVGREEYNYDVISCEERIKNLIEEMLKKKLPNDFKKYTFLELGLDSLSFVDFICKVELTEKILIDDKVLAEIKTVKDLIDLMRTKNEFSRA